MEVLDQRYTQVLDAIKDAIQNSEILAAYLEEEEDQYFVQLQDFFEPAIQDLFNEIANENPLQLVAFEKALLDPGFEGLFLPKILGYSVLRGEIDDNYKYRKPQDHFKAILLAICNSANFEMLNKRIGQTIQLGFALSSDIWITNIIDSQSNKRVKTFLNSLRNDKFRELKNRVALYESYSKQLDNVNFASSKFPTSAIELRANYHSLRSFVAYRGQQEVDNSELIKDIKTFINNESLQTEKQYVDIFLIIGLLYDLDPGTTKEYTEVFAQLNKNDKDFTTTFFRTYEAIQEDSDIVVTPQSEQRLSKLVSNAGNTEVKKYFEVADDVHSKGFVSPDSIESVSKYYENHKGMSLQNECLRASILAYIKNFISHLEADNYPDYMEINKVVIAYIGIFSNEKFNQEVKDVSMEFIHKCMKKYTDKKSKDYQDVKKYVSTTFVDLGFLSQKETVELFKTRRKTVAKKS